MSIFYAFFFTNSNQFQSKKLWILYAFKWALANSQLVTFKCDTKFDILSSLAWIRFSRPLRWHAIQLTLIFLFAICKRISKKPCSNSWEQNRGGCKSVDSCSASLWRSDNRKKLNSHIVDVSSQDWNKCMNLNANEIQIQISQKKEKN